MMSVLSVLTIDLRVEDSSWTGSVDDLESVCDAALGASARQLGVSGAVDLLLTDNAQMQQLNAQWRDKDRPTDILSFPSDERFNPPGGQRFLGDLVVGFEVTSEDALKLNRPLSLHLSHLLVHGFLHLLGYDHISSADASEMEALEAEILADFGLPDPYGDTA